MYYCETDMSGNKIFCEKSLKGMQQQKDTLKKSRSRLDFNDTI